MHPMAESGDGYGEQDDDNKRQGEIHFYEWYHAKGDDLTHLTHPLKEWRGQNRCKGNAFKRDVCGFHD